MLKIVQVMRNRAPATLNAGRLEQMVIIAGWFEKR